MAKFRLVLLDDYDEVTEVLYESRMYEGDRWNREFSKDNYDCLLKYNGIYNFVDYDNVPPMEFQIDEKGDGNWKFLSDPIVDYFNT